MVRRKTFLEVIIQGKWESSNRKLKFRFKKTKIQILDFTFQLKTDRLRVDMFDKAPLENKPTRRSDRAQGGISIEDSLK